MNYVIHKLHSAYMRLTHGNSLPTAQRGITNIDEVSALITTLLTADAPCMIARYGSIELDAVCNYLGVTMGKKPFSSAIGYIANQRPEWWWNPAKMEFMRTNAGFFPATPDAISRFAELTIADTAQLDALGSWRKNESFLAPYFSPHLKRFDREAINPFFAKKPWTLALEGKRVLVVHPFAQSIEQQYARKALLFPRPVLPDFHLQVIPAVQSIGGQSHFPDWFAALDSMKQQIDQTDFDVALLGCGAYGFSLAAHIKRSGRKAVHVGGSLQLFFGIKGKRWESKGYKAGPHDYSKLFNDYWIRPQQSEKPSAAALVENGCYW